MNQRQDQIIAEVKPLSEWFDIYKYIIDQGRTLPPLENQYKTEENQIAGCQSKVWIIGRLKAGKVELLADSDALITKGILSLLLRVLSDQFPQDILHGLAGTRRAGRVAWALDAFDLAESADSPSAELALGYKQRLAMACALMHEPEILFLDEPTSGVDPLARREFWRRINALAHAGVTVLVTTHFMEEAEYCDRLAIMAAGEILATGEPADIKARARSEGAPEPTMEEAFIRLIEAAAEVSP